MGSCQGRGRGEAQLSADQESWSKVPMSLGEMQDAVKGQGTERSSSVLWISVGNPGLRGRRGRPCPPRQAASAPQQPGPFAVTTTGGSGFPTRPRRASSAPPAAHPPRSVLAPPSTLQRKRLGAPKSVERTPHTERRRAPSGPRKEPRHSVQLDPGRGPAPRTNQPHTQYPTPHTQYPTPHTQYPAPQTYLLSELSPQVGGGSSQRLPPPPAAGAPTPQGREPLAF